MLWPGGDDRRCYEAVKRSKDCGDSWAGRKLLFNLNAKEQETFRGMLVITGGGNRYDQGIAGDKYQ
jgi:hypothetical protein